ncbi:MAG: EAL domain-containing protein [Cyanobacteria bacterium P01_G01_bin.54]
MKCRCRWKIHIALTFSQSSKPLIRHLPRQVQRLKQLQRWQKRWRPSVRPLWVAGRSIALCSVVLTSLFWGARQLGGLEFLELAMFDWYRRLQPDAALDSRMLLVLITEDDLHRYRWPLPDQVLAESLAKLQRYQPRVIGLDLYRDIPTPPGTAALHRQFQADNLIAITEIIGDIPPPPHVPDTQVGFNDLTLDTDGVLRRSLLFVAAPERDYYSFALRLTLAYFQPDDLQFRYTPDALFLGEMPLFPLDSTSGGYQIADTRGYQILLDYRTRNHSARTITLRQLLEDEVNPEWVQDKVVLIGTAAASLKDSIYTPYSADDQTLQMSGVMIHAQITRHLLAIAAGEPRSWQFWSDWQELLWLWGWTLLGGILAWRSPHPLALGGATLLGLILIGSIGWGLLSIGMVWIPIAEPMLAFIIALGLALSYRLLYTTHYDALTGLPNRRAFSHALQQFFQRQSWLRCAETLGVMLLDLDHFQMINESLGQSAGDELLIRVTQRLLTQLPRSAQLARLSNDEFAVALQCAEPETLTTLAEHLQQTLAEPFWFNTQSVTITLSIGIAMTQRGHQYTSDTLLRDAQTAMYRAKVAGTDQYKVFSTGMLTEVVDRFTLENDLRQGIADQQFILYYQPIVALETEKIVGFEALTRWQHPQQGLMSPSRFIPLAEETGLIIPLGEWICQESCHQVHQWQHQFPELSLMLSINLSGRQFDKPDFHQQLARIIQAEHIDGSMLKFEITESMIMGDVEAAIDSMLKLKSSGCKLGLDDFGTGYSSLSQLRRFPVDTIKVDQSFVQKMRESHEDHEIVRMIISLGHILGMDLIAEGVENQVDVEVLRSLGCEYGQGYFWSRPLPAAQATELLQQQYFCALRDTS